MRYGVQGSAVGDRTVEMASGDSSGGMYVISGLSAATVYTVEVAAVNSAGNGLYSDLLTILTSGTALFLFWFYAIERSFHLQLLLQWYH